MFGTSFVSGVAVLVSALATSAAVQSRCDAQTMAAAAVTIGVANDVPSGVITPLGGLRGTARCDDPDPLRRRDEIDDRAARRLLRDLGRGARLQARRRRARRAARPGTWGSARCRSLPTAATTSAPESCSARSDSMSAVDGLAVAETLTTCAPFRRSQPNASRRPCSKRRVVLQRFGLDDSRRQQRRVRHEAHDAHVGAVRDQDAGHRRAVPDRDRAATPHPAGREMQAAAAAGARGDRRRRPSRPCR